ncbi:CD209 antigen-like protein C isoform X2 [Triplophysa rosa]|uniref:CD209 antigen-like protein E n=1 Tax=Triplophysa rosa TaxID=992332 RepID=A0A9W7T4W3_TRIRA|nr:CD209 antigen-like protein C isoform X2 [Triplophysa rosa]KAI7789983.1 putative CD209 antigen-like protein E [Triplophysa rosa]
MDPVYENSAYKDSTAEFRGDSTQYKGQTLCKRTKVLLIVLSVSVVIAVGGLCVLGVLYLNKRVDFESLHAQHEMVLMQLSDQEINNTRLIVSSCKPCEDGWTEHGGKCYFFSSEAQTWFKSRNSCEALKANLVTINTRDVQGFLVSKIKETHWIGLDDLETEGRWVWVNNQTLEETGLQFWFIKASGSEPDNTGGDESSPGEDCACLGYENVELNSWFDASCETKKKFICEKRKFISASLTNYKL